MNIETVNELIQSLESAGEPSIREQKFLKLAKEFKQLAAENVALKAAVAEEIEVINRGGQRYCVKDGMSINPIYARGWNDHRANVTAVQTPATDAYLAGIKADAITASLDACSDYLETDCVMDRIDISYEEAEKRTSGEMEFHDAMVNFANQMREGAE
ncbi:hypothetical protein [Klebsiella pneumoniae]|uniref:hypothetical protein n=1 Tax=Klebsiella pneumoniae TaxID=573 RepID=UPI0020B16027|nr:hypothetical protein [Klebsiella pneumoniae]